MKVEEVVRNIFHLRFPNQYELCETFMRFQESHDNPFFRGKRFTREEFREWHLNEKGCYTYHMQWHGFNIPSTILDPFYDGKFDPLDEREKALLDPFVRLRDRLFYLIGTHEEAPPEFSDALKHEIAHGFFCMHPGYRAGVLEILAQIDPQVRSYMQGELSRGWDYHPDIIDDETHGYLLTGLEELAKIEGLDVGHLMPLHHQLEAHYQRWEQKEQVSRE